MGAFFRLRNRFNVGMLALLVSCFAAAQSNLPPQVQADLIQNQIADAARSNDLRGVLAKIDEYKKLPVVMPPTLLLVEAKAAQSLKDPLRAWTALQAFLQVAKRDTPGYQEALTLYPQYQRAAAPAMQAIDNQVQQSFAAAEKGDVAFLATLPPAALNVKDADGWTPIAFAAAAGQTETLKFLLGKGVDVNAQNNKGMTPLMLAVVSKKPEAISLLKGANADVGIRNVAGASAYELALKSQDDAVITTLTAGMPKTEYLTNLADLKPDYVAGQSLDESQRERQALVNPKGYNRNGVLLLLLESKFLSLKDYRALPHEVKDSLSELDKIMHRYAESKGLQYDHVTFGRLLTLLVADYDKSYAQLWTRIRASTGELSGQAGLYMGSTPMNFCGPNNVNLFVWSEGNTILVGNGPLEETWGRMLIVKKGGSVRTKIKKGDGSSETIDQTQYFIQEIGEDGKSENSWVKIGQDYLSMAVDGPIWHRCKQ